MVGRLQPALRARLPMASIVRSSVLTKSWTEHVAEPSSEGQCGFNHRRSKKTSHPLPFDTPWTVCYSPPGFTFVWDKAESA